MTWVFDGPLAFDFRPLPPVVRDDELRLRDEADEEGRFDALARRFDELATVFGLPREVAPLLLPELLRLLLLEALRPLGLDPSELREVCFRFVEVPAWAMAPP